MAVTSTRVQNMINSYVDVMTPTSGTPANNLATSYQTLLDQAALARSQAANGGATNTTSNTNNSSTTTPNHNHSTTAPTTTTPAVNTPIAMKVPSTQAECHGSAVIMGGGPSTLPLRNIGTRAAGSQKPITVTVGKASFSLPPVAVSDKSVKPPAVKWGPGWTKQADGSFRHTNGAKAISGTQPRVSVSNPSKIKIVDTPHGRGQRLPSGDIVGIDKKGVPFHLDPKGHKHKLAFGTFKYGGMSVRVFQARTVDISTPDGRRMRYDSRGNIRLGRGNAGRLVSGGGPSGAAAGASQCGAHGGTTTQKTSNPDLLGGLNKLVGDLNKNITITQKSDPADVKLLNDAMKMVKQLFGTLESGDDSESLGGPEGLLGILGGLGQSLLGGTSLG